MASSLAGQVALVAGATRSDVQDAGEPADITGYR